MATSIGDLLACLPNMSDPLTKQTAIESIHECVLTSARGVISQFAKLLRKGVSTVHGWHRGKRKIPLYDLVRVGYCLDLSILDLLKGADAIRKRRITIRELPNAAQLTTKFRRLKPFNHIVIEAALAEFLNVWPPISAAEAARRIGVGHRDLYRKFPRLCSSISERYREYLQDSYRMQRAKLEEEVRAAVIQLHAKGIYVSPRPVAEYLNKPSYVGRRDVGIIIRETREMLDAKRRAG